MGLGHNIKRIFTWWDGQSFGTQIWTRRHGEKVGEDDQGNVYYRNADDTRRWVIYDGENEASRVSPEWHGWLHHTWDEPPTEGNLRRKSWEQPHQENLTGTMAAYAPAGSIRKAAPVERSDYEAWSPE
ncbi:NADH:ubiquinone oxidoreductase subunit NDUFA12 [Cognatiyoonia sp. IB215182]|uniref:NADH:ubiquinone oxidoreductase subunit NDUFA12 n=1 Tax=Cognatiyoonia sp. IB215182 TaxID=3097353 RepID=UPI002A123F5E|nr:NADH:ubiquinone oxidoreductase subunit NDUFA12 [Cognatiyoonia sp. IB215182]MDX8354469.1 NADH:ubiquinone oxidoreductase subunit NDUFA12 [Cognatiyoonia sp. IB215182]